MYKNNKKPRHHKPEHMSYLQACNGTTKKKACDAVLRQPYITTITELASLAQGSLLSRRHGGSHVNQNGLRWPLNWSVELMGFAPLPVRPLRLGRVRCGPEPAHNFNKMIITAHYHKIIHVRQHFLIRWTLGTDHQLSLSLGEMT